MSQILVVDDSRADRQLCKVILEAVPAREFLEASRGEEAVAMHARHRPDCVILDQGLPDMSGLEVARRLLAADADAAIVMLTGSTAIDVAIGALRQGVVDYVSKERLSREALNRSVMNALRVRDLKQRKAAAHRLLEETVRDLRTKNREVRSFYHTLSHELKTPLTSMQEFLSILLDEIPGSINEEQEEYLTIVRQNCRRLSRHVNDILDVTRIETGKLSLDRAIQEPARLVSDAVASAGPVASRKGLRLLSKVEPDLPEVFADAARIAQVLSNLLGNAMKFTETSGTIRVEARAAGAEFVEFLVADTGRGIDADSQPLIFDRLFQAREGDAALESGTGLGLNICRDLVRLHGGEIAVDSVLGHGSTFRFSIPTAESVRGEERSPAIVRA
ncbi:MAG: ATP-binding protein [Planctomycetota bacterium JB042]